MKLISDRLNLIAKPLKDAGIPCRLGKWSLLVEKQGRMIKDLIDLFLNDIIFIRVIVVGDKALIVDDDILLNRKFLGIFGEIPNSNEASLSVGLKNDS